jgi:hypothetical protein
MLIGSTVFVVLSILFVSNPQKYISVICNNPIIIFIAGIAGILFFGLCSITFLIKLFDNSAGLIISNEGIFDNSGGLSVGFIPWSDIIEIGEIKISFQTLLKMRTQSLINIIVKNPQDYIDKQKNILKRKGIEYNYKKYNSVISITVNGLQYDYPRLLELLKMKLAEYRHDKQ